MEIIDSIVSVAGDPKAGPRSRDDVALVPHGAGNVVFKTDMLVEHTDMPPGMSYRQAARKAVAMCVSDFAAKGTRPHSFMVSLGLRKGTTREEVGQLAKGFRDAEEKWSLKLVGGDTNEAKELVIDCAMIGFGDRIVWRGGASPGDRLFVTGPFGYQASGLKILTSGASANARFRTVAIKGVLEPEPNLEAGLSLAPFMTAAMDSSDGLSRSIHTLAKESGVGFELDRLPMGTGVKEFADANGLDPDELVLAGGEEYVIVGTMKKPMAPRATAAASRAGVRLLDIGRATTKKGRVILKGKKGRDIPDAGWTHLR